MGSDDDEAPEGGFCWAEQSEDGAMEGSGHPFEGSALGQTDHGIEAHDDGDEG